MAPEILLKYLAWWGWNGSAQRRFGKKGNRSYRIYLWTIFLGPLFFANVFFGWPPALYPLFGYAFLLWALWLAVALWLITRVDIYDSIPVGIRLAIVFWAGGAANGASGFLIALLSDDVTRTSLSLLSAVTTEEFMKFLCLLLIFGISKPIFKRPLGAIVCGFIAGIAFAFSESLKLSFSVINSAVENGEDLFLIDWVYRRGILSSPWTHSTATALSALALWAIATKLQRSKAATILLSVAFCAASVGLHFGYNSIVLGNGNIKGIPFFMVPETITFIPFVLLTLWGIRREQMWFCNLSERLQPYINVTDSRILLTRLCRAEARSRTRSQYGRRRAREVGILQRLQTAYANVRGDEESITSEKDKADLEFAMDSLNISNN